MDLHLYSTMFALELLAVSQSRCGVIQLEPPEHDSTRFSLFYAEKEGRKQEKERKRFAHVSDQQIWSV